VKVSQNIRRQLFLGTTMLGPLLLGYGRRAYAGSCAGAGGTYTCSGAAAGGDTTQNLNGTPLTVTTNPGFGISTGANPAFSLTGTGGLSFTDANTSSIAGSTIGIYGKNTGSGVLSITTTGTVAGTNSFGIDAVNTGTDLTIQAFNVNGASNGIFANNMGSGAAVDHHDGDRQWRRLQRGHRRQEFPVGHRPDDPGGDGARRRLRLQ
jgi:autotransporter family porin